MTLYETLSITEFRYVATVVCANVFYVFTNNIVYKSRIYICISLSTLYCFSLVCVYAFVIFCCRLAKKSEYRCIAVYP